uniref:Uncharacterized protein n=1 Tax=Myoviridae sp. ctIty1 TaxID=2827673 RepID=A0A8S5TGT3_9CAUD|nr:MAG TPA: hypothetical protein [Myoviridae sp. ctIty1]
MVNTAYYRLGGTEGWCKGDIPIRRISSMEQ